MRSRLAVFVACVLIAVAGQAGPAAAEADECLAFPPTLSQDTDPVQTIVLKNTRTLPIEMRAYRDSLDCSGMTVDVQKVDGSVKTTVALTHQGGRGMPPSWTWYGYLQLTAATGEGDWVITKVTHGANVLETEVTFHVYRGSELTLDQPARTSGTARTTLSGQLRRYTNTGALVPAANTTVKILHWTQDLLIATAKTDATGRFKITVAFTRNTTLRATTIASGNYVAEYTDWKTAHKLLAMSYLTASPTAVVNGLWKVSGTAFPGRLYTSLERWTGTAWWPAGSAGYTAADGSYARYWRPSQAGTFRLRVVVSGPGLDNSPWSREVTVAARQLPQQPTYVTGTVTPTAGLPVTVNSLMTTYGFLKVRRADGSLGPLTGRRVEVLAKRPDDVTWRLAATPTTTSSGYFAEHWYPQGFRAGDTVTVVLRYTSTSTGIASVTSAPFGPFTIQP